MKVSETMTPDVRIVSPSATLQAAARAMAELDAGALPVGERDRLVGMITDRDIAVRGVAMGLGPTASVGEVMTEDVKYCFADQDLDEVVRNMGDSQVRRLPVVNRETRPVGILSLGDATGPLGGSSAGDPLIDTSRPGGAHSQTG